MSMFAESNRPGCLAYIRSDGNVNSKCANNRAMDHATSVALLSLWGYCGLLVQAGWSVNRLFALLFLLFYPKLWRMGTGLKIWEVYLGGKTEQPPNRVNQTSQNFPISDAAAPIGSSREGQDAPQQMQTAQFPPAQQVPEAENGLGFDPEMPVPVGRTFPNSSAAIPLLDEKLSELIAANGKRHRFLQNTDINGIKTDIDVLRCVATTPNQWSKIASKLGERLAQLGEQHYLKRENSERQSLWSVLRHVQAIATIVAAYASGNVWNNGTLTEVGKGCYNTVYGFLDADNSAKVFKPMGKDYRSNHSVLGLEVAANIAAAEIASFLSKDTGHSLIAGATVAIVNGHVGIAMPHISGRPLDKISSSDPCWMDPNFRSQATGLQLEDCIIGCIDRHHQNVLWDEKRLVAVDTDLAFQWSESGNAGICEEKLYDRKNYTPLPIHFAVPPTIDDSQKKMLDGISPRWLEGVLKKAGLFEGQITAAISRLEFLKKYPFKIIRKDQWGDNTLLKQHGCSKFNCYFFYYRAQCWGCEKGITYYEANEFLPHCPFE
ncbi:MAG: hypothetical protein LBS68_03410 [Puniceicoccales bacterium]|nr:hypothetical protein [Puniceicoccales bacterium]